MFVGLGGVFYGIASAPQIVDQIAVSGLPWTVVSATLIFGSAALMAAAARWLRFQFVYWSILGFAAAYLTAMLLWIPMHGAGKLATGMALWLTYSVGLTAVALGAIAGWRACVFVAITFVALSRILTRTASDQGVVPLAADLFLNISFVCVFALAINSFVRTGRALDRTAEQARLQAAVTASVQARDSERRRFDALVHDGVLATLLAAAKSGDQVSAATSRQARETLGELRRLRLGPEGDGAVTPAAAIASIRAAVENTYENAVFRMSTDERDLHSIPEIAVEALVAGVTEAVRNVVRHSHASQCVVSVECDTDAVSVTIADDGIGFDPARIPANRLGLAVSIEGRFADLVGGWSSVDTELGRGTTIQVGWSA